MRWGAVIVAAGRGERFGRPKQLVEIAGRPMVAWSISTFGAMPEIVDLVVATEPEHRDAIAELARVYAPRLRSTVVAGGPTRQDSVRAGIAAVPERCAGTLVHDGARPLITAAGVRAGMRAVKRGTASLLAQPVVDTIKVVDARRGLVLRTLDRDELWAAETPQFALTAELRRAHIDAHRNGTAATDDATLLERAGLDVLVVPSTAENFKITVPADLDRAETLLARRTPPPKEEEEILVIEAFVPRDAVEPVTRELEARRGRVDAVDRDLPEAVVVRAYVPADDLHGFGDRFAALAGEDAVFTAHHAHFAPRPAAT
jgi:2-C-methyl-D-erythritol 4-phosphate cytidylyltransferase